MADAGRTGPDDLTAPDPVDDYYSIAMLLSTIIPVFGGAVGHVFNEWASARRVQRLREVLLGVTEQIQALGARVREEYVRSEEFEDLLDQTLRRVAHERHEEKRRLYRGLLVNALTSASAEYDEQLRFLRVVEDLQGAHVRVLRALVQPPVLIRVTASSPLDALTLKLPDASAERIVDLIEHLQGLGVVNASWLQAPVSAPDTRALLTDFGRRFLDYVLAEVRQ
jgi:hypothetical protein